MSGRAKRRRTQQHGGKLVAFYEALYLNLYTFYRVQNTFVVHQYVQSR